MPDFRVIPPIDALRQRAGVRALEAEFGAAATVDALRESAASARTAIAGGDATLTSADRTAAWIETAAATTLRRMFHPSLEPVINATGVIVHTNLGRAPLSASAIARVVDVARGYSSLEYDVGRGARGRRDVHAEALLCRLTGAEAAVVVNNNAAATMLVLAALAAGREVIVSRGELVEIGGGFRVPDVMAQSGAILREVGTTNKTRAADYAAAISDRTALILRVHPSNFRIEGFTERPRLADLAALGCRFEIPVAEDLGSGKLGAGSVVSQQPEPGPTREERPNDPVASEPAVRHSIADGVSVCCFSGDKLLGGPQAGIIVGRATFVDVIRRHPLMRALRVDKLTYAALEATLADYAAGRASDTVPVQRMVALTRAELRARADALAAAMSSEPGWRAEVIAGASAIGGGSAPGVELETWLVAIARDGVSTDALEARLRRLKPPVVARIVDDRLVLDLRTVMRDQDATLAALLRETR
jgi:L-seryl-tRNA(Ser) seleniumtransferase